MEYLVIDVGGTAIKYACMNENAEFLERGEIPTPMDSLDSYLAALGTIIHRYDHNVEGIAMCVPGIIDSVQGVHHRGEPTLCKGPAAGHAAGRTVWAAGITGK